MAGVVGGWCGGAADIKHSDDSRQKKCGAALPKTVLAWTADCSLFKCAAGLLSDTLDQ